jgi:pimeloyl-ACP methyl ester carboxylesterase
MEAFRFFALFCFIGCCSAFNGFTSLYNTHEEPPIDVDDYKSTTIVTVREKWIQQKLDHFNPQDSREWKMRYFQNDRFLRSGEITLMTIWLILIAIFTGGPIFIFVGGEWEISPGWISVGLIFEMAKELNGTLFYTEHRYYGKSQPTSDTSTKNLKYLTVEQALADLAYFIEHVKASSDDLTNSGVILVGASYSATLATWARMKYPHLVNGAWASSAPLFAKLDFFEYNELMTESIKTVGGEKCLEKFDSAFRQLEDYVGFSEPKVLAKIKNDFQLCEPLKLCRDVAHFFYELSDTVAGLVQSHKFGDIEKACEFMLDEKHSDPVAALGAWVNSKKKKKCQDMNYENTVKKFNNATWGSEANRQLRQWTYQVEFHV